MITIIIIYMKKLLDSNWLRAVQLLCNSVQKGVFRVRTGPGNPGKPWKIFKALEIPGNPGKALEFFCEALENLTKLY